MVWVVNILLGEIIFKFLRKDNFLFFIVSFSNRNRNVFSGIKCSWCRGVEWFKYYIIIDCGG